MQFLKIDENTSLSDLRNVIGDDGNLDSVLALNGLNWKNDVGRQLKQITDKAKSVEMASDEDSIIQRKITLLNRCSSDEDVFQTASTLDQEGWNIFAATGTFENTLRIPDHIILPKTDDVIGNTKSVSKDTYNKVIADIKANTVPSDTTGIFGTYTSEMTALVGSSPITGAFNWFELPLGEITLYSSLADDSIDFPCYPSEFSDGIKANYDTMPDMLYQYEPWQVYKGSGPRQCSFTFDIHRDMWSGNHNDGKCNELIRFCEANCYPRYNGAAVNTATVTMYIRGKALVSGILTDVTPNWDTDSPIGHDGFYLHLKLQLTVVEIAQEALSYDVYRMKGLIG